LPALQVFDLVVKGIEFAHGGNRPEWRGKPEMVLQKKWGRNAALSRQWSTAPGDRT
jgi:hypothetical protein